MGPRSSCLLAQVASFLIKTTLHHCCLPDITLSIFFDARPRTIRTGAPIDPSSRIRHLAKPQAREPIPGLSHYMLPSVIIRGIENKSRLRLRPSSLLSQTVMWSVPRTTRLRRVAPCCEKIPSSTTAHLRPCVPIQTLTKVGPVIQPFEHLAFRT